MLRFIGKTLLVLLGIVAVVVLILAAVRFFVIPRAFPQVDGEIRLPGLDGPVDIYRDSFGVPHLYASSEHDLFMAQGFVHAQDRFWQMEFWRRIGSGRLSEILGESALDQDKFIRTLGWNRAAVRDLELLPEAELAILEAYSEGVNAYLDAYRGNLGLEFTVLGLTGVRFDPEPWTPLNTVTWTKVMAWDLGGNWDRELARAHLVAKLGTPALSALMPGYTEGYPLIVPDLATEAALQAIPAQAFDGFALGSGPDIGSNNWVVDGEGTATGAPMLANDPHLGFRIPSIWYEIGLHCEPKGSDCPLDMVGASFAGVPGIVIGHNDHIAWGVTNVGPDVQDLFIERINPENPNQYEFRGQWVDMEVIREEIRVAGEQQPVYVDVRLTHHGPIINDVVGGVEEEWDFGWQPLAFSWTALEPGTIVQSILKLDRASNWEEFREALALFDVPSQNFVYADVEGNIGYQMPGRVPIRANGDGSMPVPGWSGEYEWVGLIPYDDLPRAFNPPQGYIATANNAVVGSDYPYFISMDWSPGFRARRIVELLEADDSLALVDMQAIQRDNTPLYAQDILHTIVALQPSEARLAQALDILRSWDGRTNQDSAGAVLFEALRLAIVEEVFADELGEQLLERIRGSLQVTLIEMLNEPDAPWFDDRYTDEVEDRDAILLRALERAVDWLSEQLGKDMNDWRWGALHTVTFENETLGQSGIAPIEMIFNRGPYEVDGTSGAVNNVGASSTEPFSSEGGPSYRQIIDLGDFGRSVSMHTTGQSGHAFHPHYDDMIDPWRNVQYHPMLWTRSQVESAAESHLVLRP